MTPPCTNRVKTKRKMRHFDNLLCEEIIFPLHKGKHHFFREYWKQMKQEGMTFDHDFCYFILLFSSPLKKEGREKESDVAKIVIKSHPFLFHPGNMISSLIQQVVEMSIPLFQCSKYPFIPRVICIYFECKYLRFICFVENLRKK